MSLLKIFTFIEITNSVLHTVVTTILLFAFNFHTLFIFCNTNTQSNNKHTPLVFYIFEEGLLVSLNCAQIPEKQLANLLVHQRALCQHINRMPYRLETRSGGNPQSIQLSHRDFLA